MNKKVKFTFTTTMSASRIGGAEGMDVDETEVALPTSEWMEAAQRAADTDGILENSSAKRQKVCNPCSTLTALHLQTLLLWPARLRFDGGIK